MTDEIQTEQAPKPERKKKTEHKPMTFAEVAKWNRENADKLPPLEQTAPRRKR